MIGFLVKTEPTGLKRRKDIVMLVEKLSNSWVKFLVTGKGAREAFLYVIATYGAFSHNKEKMLAKIVEKDPSVTGQISDGDLSDAFYQLVAYLRQRNEVLSPAELEWVGQYVRHPNTRTDIELLIYRCLVEASSHWDKMRQEYQWNIPKAIRTGIIRDVLGGDTITAKRKTELATEIGVTLRDCSHGYFKKLLWDRHYDKAAELNIVSPDPALEVVIDNLNASYFDDALAVAERFLPDQQEVAEEIKKIREAVSGS